MAISVSELKSPTFLLKWLELALAIGCFALLRTYGGMPALEIDKIAVCYATICGYLLINSVLILGFFAGEQTPKIVSILFLVAGGVLWITAGAFMIELYENKSASQIFYSRDKLLPPCILAVINGVVYLLDSFFTFKG